MLKDKKLKFLNLKLFLKLKKKSMIFLIHSGLQRNRRHLKSKIVVKLKLELILHQKDLRGIVKMKHFLKLKHFNLISKKNLQSFQKMVT